MPSIRTATRGRIVPTTPASTMWRATSGSCAERCAHANLCGYAKAVLEQVEQSGIRALVLTNCCDAMLRVYDVLAASGKMEFLQLLPVPHQSTPATRARFARDLRRLADALQRYTGQEFDAQRAHAFFVHNPTPRSAFDPAGCPWRQRAV